MQLQEDQLREHEEEDQVISLAAKSSRSSKSLNDVITDLIASNKRSKKSKPTKTKRSKKTVSKKKKNKKNYARVLSSKKSNRIEKIKNNQDEVDLNNQLLQKLIYLNSLNLINNQAVSTSPPPPNNYAELNQNVYSQANYKPVAPMNSDSFNPTLNNENISVQKSAEQEAQTLNLRHNSYRPKESKEVYRTYLNEDDYELNDWDETTNVIDLRGGDYSGKPQPKKSTHGSYQSKTSHADDGEFVVDLRASNAKSQRRVNHRNGHEIVIKLII